MSHSRLNISSPQRSAKGSERIAAWLSASEVRAAFPAGTVLYNPVTGEYARTVEHTAERGVAEMVAVPGGAVAGPHLHPGQDERFEVLEGVMGYRRGEERGELGPGESVNVPRGVMHDWWNAGEENLRAPEGDGLTVLLRPEETLHAGGEC